MATSFPLVAAMAEATIGAVATTIDDAICYAHAAKSAILADIHLLQRQNSTVDRKGAAKIVKDLQMAANGIKLPDLVTGDYWSLDGALEAIAGRTGDLLPGDPDDDDEGDDSLGIAQNNILTVEVISQPLKKKPRDTEANPSRTHTRTVRAPERRLFVGDHGGVLGGGSRR
jgi:hypothetical protein